MNEWSLDVLYKGYDDEAFRNDFKKMDTLIQRCTQAADQLSHTDETAALHSMLSLLEEFHTLADRVGHFISLKQSTNTSDGRTVSLMNQFSQKFSGITKANARFNRYVAEIEDLDACIEQDALLKEYSYLLHTIKEDSKYLLSDDVEDVLSKMNISGGEAWANLQEYLTSIVEVDYKKEATTLSQIRNMAYDSDPQVRKSAYEAELKAYDKIRDAVAFSLNSIKAQVLTECELRGFASPLAMTLHNAHMKQETLDALLHTMQSYMPKFHAYLKRKAELLGYKNGLPWYELFAPLGEETKTYRVEEAKEYLLKHFRPFAEDMADMMERAFDENWIDFFPRKGKVGGAFCANLSGVKQSRVLTNYDGALGDIVTLAHELGHAYHGMMIENHRPLNTDYSMPVAETASTFNENIIMNAAIEEAKGQEKITLIENQLQDLTQVICDIYSRFLFEKTVFEKRKDSFMFADELEAIMIETQKQAYGDGLDPDYLHPYMWICKSHYYSSGLSFYNFPYAFGALFARGLIVKYQQEKDAFVPKYRELLKATTISSVEDVAAMADIDLCDEAFWTSCLDTCAQRIDEFLELTK
ncbi:M3 family oligoendopeptidase [[Clostridium] innocuum]|nr:M3 family oligoendopeptidase [Erysipelotrichaceae bacterium]MCR0384300.1 M3 family oligoendopeptidase [[Clostridium] innocuum]MCR0411531.1 M3 family oligoendopeptidase [[Clostridium] innocuum]MCR0533618.1 M3 family oligoendopeptidase [[Clostridium] innocuum]MCR0537229.1 M3 family oligoendopeptidase [[Clostridium] innocuum]